MVGRFSNIGKLCYHFCAIVGLVSIVGIFISWNKAEPSANAGGIAPFLVVKDYTVPNWQAAAAIEAYKWRINATKDSVAAGYFISKEAINFMLKDVRNNGVFVYPGFNGAGKFCLVAEGFNLTGAGFTERADYKIVMCETSCPKDCGTFQK